MAEQQITDMGTKAAPSTRTTKQSERFELLAVNATFTGTGAASAYLPCVEVISDSGAVVSRTFAASVAAGSSAEVTFAPFLRDPTQGGGIQFDTDPQSGDWLLVETTGTNPATSYSLDLYSQDDMRLRSDTFIELDAGDIELNGGNVDITGAKTQSLFVSLGTIDITSPVGSTGHISLSSRGQLILESSALWSGQSAAAMVLDAVTTLKTSSGGDTEFRLLVAATHLTVKDHTGAAIFRVDENGDLHGKTGKALTFDL
jgi:hypothetical protein